MNGPDHYRVAERLLEEAGPATSPALRRSTRVFNSAVVAGIVTSAFDVIVAIFSEDTFHDIIAALGIMIY